MRLPIHRTVLLALAPAIVAGCGSVGGHTGSVLPPVTQLPTAISRSPQSVPVPPMQGLTGTRPAMSLRKPQSEISALTFTQLPGAAVYVAASPDGTFWVLSTQGLNNGIDKYIYHYVNGTYVNVPGAASRIAVGPDSTPWVLNSAGGIYHLVNGLFQGIAGGASEISVGGTASAPLVDVISNQAPGPYGAGIYQYNVNAGTWSQLPGAGVTVAASIDSGTYPALNINPGGFYVTNQLGGIFYYNVGVGFEQLPGGAVRLAPTADGGIFALGDPTNPVQHGIYYNDLSTGQWTQMPGAAVSISANSQNVYAIGAAGGIYVSPITAASPVTVDANSPALATVGPDVYGGNFFAYDDPSESPIVPALRTANVHMVRFPGGVTSDYYHWETNTYSSCFFTIFNPASQPVITFDQFESLIAQPLNADVNVTINYGSNSTCTGGADPTEAAAWVAHAKTMGESVKYWTIGNEQYFSGPNGPTPDFHTPPGATTYANQVATEFYPLMKAQDSNAQIGVDLAAPNNNASAMAQAWDGIVLSQAKYDFVEVHVVPAQQSGSNDAYLLTQGVSLYPTTFAQVRSELAAAGHPNVPIYVGEWNANDEDGAPAPKEHVTIAGGLWASMVIGEFLNAGVDLATFFAGVESPCSSAVGNPDYGWPTFATYSMINESANASANGCPGASLPPVGTLYPPAIAMQIDGTTFHTGDSMIAPTVSSSLPTVRVYASKNVNGYGILLVNTDQNDAVTTTVGIAHDARTFTGTTLMYDKAIFDQGASGASAAAFTPTSGSLGSVSGTFPITLPPWSMTGVQLTTTTGSSNARVR